MPAFILEGNSVNCIVLGTDHQLQPRDKGLRRMIVNLILNSDIRLIAEEWRSTNPVPTVASHLAERFGISWIQVDMDDDVRREEGIYDSLLARSKDYDFDPITNTQTIRHYYLKHADGIREKFWLDRIQKAWVSGDVLLICGWTHLQYVASKARDEHHWHVTTHEYMPNGPIVYDVRD